MELNDKVSQLEDEIKILKNEIQAVLLDLRESYLSAKNPFNNNDSPAFTPQGAINVPQAPVQETTQIQEVSPTPSSVSVATLREPETVKPVALLENIENQTSFEAIETSDNGISSLTKRVAKKPSPMIKGWKQKPPVETPFDATERRINTPKEIDLKIISRLSAWVDNALNLVGTARTLAIIDIAEVMGYISGELRNILKKFVVPAPVDSAGAKYNPKDYLSVWLELAQILGRDNKSEIALLYILCQESENR